MLPICSFSRNTMQVAAYLLFLATSSYIADAFRNCVTTSVSRFVERHNQPSSLNESDFPRQAKAIIETNSVCDTSGITLKGFMSEISILNPEAREISSMFGAIETACKAISGLLRRSQLPTSNFLGFLDGETANNGSEKEVVSSTIEVLKKALRFTGRLGSLASEEEEEGNIEEDLPLNIGKKEIVIDEGEKYVVVVNPLDGSAHVDAGVPTGSVFGIYEYDEACLIEAEECPVDSEDEENLCLACSLQPGTNLVAAAYCLYSSSVSLVLTIGSGTYAFVLDESLGEFILQKKVQIPVTSSTISFNEAKDTGWDDPVREVISKWKSGTGRSRVPFTSRYIGSMVADIHRTILRGGVFGYPANQQNPNGKLRLLYQLAPIAFLIEQAGGLATTGTHRVMDIIPNRVHQRLPAIMGSRDDVQEIIDAYQGWRK